MTGKELWASLLQEAIQGRLVEQEHDEPSENVKSTPIDCEPFPIPDNWKWCLLGDIGTSNIGLTYKPTDISKNNDGIPILRSNNIQNGKLDLKELKKLTLSKIPNKVFACPGDLLICVRNGSKSLVGKSALIPDNNNCKMVFGAFMAIYRSKYNPFLKYFLDSPYFKKLLDSVNTTTINQITQKNLLSTKCPLPPLAEQRRIVARLEELRPLVDEYGSAEAELSRLEADLPDRLRASLLQEAISGRLVEQRDDEPAVEQIGDAPEDVPFAIPEKWKWVRLKDIISMHMGGGTPSKQHSEYWGGSIPWASVKDLQGDTLTKTIDSITKQGLKNSASNLIPSGNIIICTRMGLGKIVFNAIDVAINQDLRALFLNYSIIDKWYFFYFYHTLNIIGTGLTVKGVHISNLLETLLPLPPLAEQRRIVARLEELLPEVAALRGEQRKA